MSKTDEIPSYLMGSKRENVAPYEPGVDAIDLSPAQDRSLLKEIKVQGNGSVRPRSQDRVQLHYLGFFLDGTVFDTSRDRNQKFEFTLGRGNVIRAWELGVASMCEGEIALIYCKPEHGYGEEGNPPKIPPNASLVFEVELFGFKREDLTKESDGGITRSQIIKGSGYSTPKEGATVEIHLIGRLEDKTFEERDVTFVLGEGSDDGVVEGIEVALLKFLKGEQSVLTLKPKYAFGKEGNESLGIPPNATVEYEVTLVRFEKGKETWEMDTSDKLEQASIFKNKGTEFFKAGKYKIASKQYKRIVDHMEYETNITDKSLEKQCKEMLLAGHLNLALCHLKTEEYVEARDACENALAIDGENEKALFRRGQAYMAMNDFNLSLQDFECVLKIDPNNKAASNQMVLCNVKIKEAKQKEKATYGNMFAKFAERDEMRERERNRLLPDVLINPGTWGDKTNLNGVQQHHHHHSQQLNQPPPPDPLLSNVQLLGTGNGSFWS